MFSTANIALLLDPPTGQVKKMYVSYFEMYIYRGVEDAHCHHNKYTAYSVCTEKIMINS